MQVVGSEFCCDESKKQLKISIKLSLFEFLNVIIWDGLQNGFPEESTKLCPSPMSISLVSCFDGRSIIEVSAINNSIFEMALLSICLTELFGEILLAFLWSPVLQEINVRRKVEKNMSTFIVEIGLPLTNRAWRLPVVFVSLSPKT